LPSVLVLNTVWPHIWTKQPKWTTMHASAILCNKHAYHWHAHHLNCHKDAYWVLNDALPMLLTDANLHTCLSLYEYSMSVMDFHGDFSAELDITASITHPLQDLHVLVHVVQHPEGLAELKLSCPRSQAVMILPPFVHFSHSHDLMCP
jgi:hypothetical protein